MTGPDWKPNQRIVDIDAIRRARLQGGECAACRKPPGSVHHVMPKGERGDDVLSNLLLLCGHGTVGCHGALHGNPYVYYVGDGTGPTERRDADWVKARVGRYILHQRPDVIQYLVIKLGGAVAARAYLERNYLVAVA